MNFENKVIKSINIINNPEHILYSHIIYNFGLKELEKNIEAVYICKCGSLIPLYIGRKIDPINLHNNSITHDTEIIFHNKNCNNIRKILNLLKNSK